MYKVNSLRTHPDKNIENPAAQGEFLKVSLRWETVQLAFKTFCLQMGFISPAGNTTVRATKYSTPFARWAQEQHRERYDRKKATTKHREEGNGKFVCAGVHHIMYLIYRMI